jgi:predicted transcriptional regulator YheO
LDKLFSIDKWSISASGADMIEPEDNALLRCHSATAAAISALLHPHAEVVIHDLATGRVAGIWNAFSGRRPGDGSLVEDVLDDAGATFGPYEKTGTDGRRLKSVTAVLRDDAGRAAGLLCINMDVSQFDLAAKALAAFAGTAAPRPASLFAGGWREEINTALHAFLRERGLALAGLRKGERVELVAALDRSGLFQTRKAVDHLASLMGASRASIYNYLAEARREIQKDETS